MLPSLSTEGLSYGCPMFYVGPKEKPELKNGFNLRKYNKELNKLESRNLTVRIFSEIAAIRDLHFRNFYKSLHENLLIHEDKYHKNF